MLKMFLAAALLVTLTIFGSIAQAYDLPKFKPDKKVTKTVAVPKKGPVLKSDWESADLYEQKIRTRLATGEPLPPDAPERIIADPNYIFIAFYNDAPYFLDKYSLKVKQDSEDMQVWEQRIFPITKKYSPANATATVQTFCLADGIFYNSGKKKNALAEAKNEADKIFLEECFKVGYHFAFEHAAHDD
ncbi:MAG: hypothetical protein K6G55_08235 [Selenomonadaceae bacterium]|nr:hypothetical protein [Selenomonadaceae bacterium]